MRQNKKKKKACAIPWDKQRTDAFRSPDRQYGLAEYDLRAVVTKHREGSGRKAELDINEAQKIATRVYQAVNCCKLGLGGCPRFKSFKRGLHSIEGKTNKAGLKFKPESAVLSLCGHDYRVLIDPKDDYIQRALSLGDSSCGYRKVKCCCLVRWRIRSKELFFVQVVLEGTALVKHIYASADERLATDPGPQSIAVFGKMFAGKIQVAGATKLQKAAVSCLQRSMDRSLRAVQSESVQRRRDNQEGSRACQKQGLPSLGRPPEGNASQDCGSTEMPAWSDGKFAAVSGR